jgi:hypothetical protein
MRLHCFLTIFTVTPLLVTSLSVLEVLDKTSSVLGLLETAWELVNNDLGIIELSDGKRDRMLFSKIDNINMQLVDMNEKSKRNGYAFTKSVCKHSNCLCIFKEIILISSCGWWPIFRNKLSCSLI